MTRINCVPVEELSDAHLGAEYRELPRVFRLAAAAAARGETDFPERYTLGPGHVRFFYDKLTWIADRQCEIAEECRRRGRAARFFEPPEFAFEVPKELWGDWEPDDNAMALNRARLAERNAS